MLRIPLVLAIALAACSGHAASQAYVAIGDDALAAVPELRRAHVIDDSAGVAVIAVDEGELAALPEQLHARLARCGGFFVFDSLAAAEAAAHAPVLTRPGPGYTIDRGQTVRAVTSALARGHISATIGELQAMQNRYYQSATGAAASTWLAARWRSFSPRSDITIELVDHGYAQKSVILTIPGTSRANEVVVLGGHLDSIAIGGKTSTAPGADDDASGIATLTEVVRVLLQSDYRPARTLKVMAYAAEEVGLRGSLSIARDFQKRKVDVVGALQLDMTNFQGSDKDIWLIRDYTDAAQNAFLGRLIDTYVGASWGYDECGYACSDHASWNRIGVPASMPFESRKGDMNRRIHTRGDTLENSDVNAAHAYKFAQLAAAYAIELAKGELAPDHTL